VPIWVRLLTIAEMAELSRRTASERIGMVFTGCGDDWIEGSLPLDERTRGADGALAHGALAIAAETLASVGANMCVDSGHACLGQVLHLQHAEPVVRGPVSGRATPLWIRARDQLWQIEFRDAGDARVCVAQLTLAVIDREHMPRT